MDYLANDEEVREFVAYIQSEEFPKVHKTVQYLKEYKDVSAPMCTCLKPQSDGENICSVSTGAWISLFQCFKYSNDQGVDGYAILNEIRDFFDYPPFQPTNTARTGVGIYGLIDDEIAVLPLNNLTAFVQKETETREFFRTLVTAFHSPEFTVNIHCVYWMSTTAYVMCILVCEFLWWMHYSFPQNMVHTVRDWPEYREMIENVRKTFNDVERAFELFRELFWRGNVLNTWTRDGNFMCFVLTYIKFHD